MEVKVVGRIANLAFEKNREMVGNFVTVGNYDYNISLYKCWIHFWNHKIGRPTGMNVYSILNHSQRTKLLDLKSYWRGENVTLV